MSTPILRITRKANGDYWLHVIAPSGHKASIPLTIHAAPADASDTESVIAEVAELDAPPAAAGSDTPITNGDGVLIMCLDICTPATLAAMHIDHLRYITTHSHSGDTYGCFEIIQQDADDILAHLTHSHFGGDQTNAMNYIQKIEPHHMPF